jgi:hypothetical protein
MLALFSAIGRHICQLLVLVILIVSFLILYCTNRSVTGFLCVNGGTGRGHKIFWLVPPTDKNLLLYEKWVKERTEKTEFFGDLAEGCCRLEIFGGKFGHHCEKLKTAFQLCYAQN